MSPFQCIGFTSIGVELGNNPVKRQILQSSCNRVKVDSLWFYYLKGLPFAPFVVFGRENLHNSEILF